MKRLFSCALVLFAATAMLAVPAKRTVRRVVQPDGTILELRLVGDEYFHYLATTDGVPVLCTDDGQYVYAQMSEGRLVATNVRVHDVLQRDATERTLTEELKRGIAVRPQRAIERMTTNNARRAQRTAVHKTPAHKTAVGKKKGIIILVNYTDRSMVHTQAEFHAQMNQNNYNKNGHVGSLSDYFYDQSYGQLDIDFDVVGPVTVSKNLAYYGSNDANGDDKYPGTLITEAVQLADAAGTNFSQYDWDGDGEVEQVFVIYAGYSEAADAPTNTIWPHEWTLEDARYAGNGGNGAINVDGVRINTYACSSELVGSSGSKMDGIGTAAHEFSHCLGLPDFYDTSGGEAPGMGTWSLMDYGCYNGNGCVPCAYTSYERWYSGWMEPTELDAGCNIVDMRPITEAPEAYIVYNSKNHNEYYLLENHQPSHDKGSEYRPWDSQTLGSAHGMIVLHVDYSASAWLNNTPNNIISHQRMTIVPANNKHSYYTSEEMVKGNPYPGTANNTSLTNSTTPAAKLFNANSDGNYYLNHPIEQITELQGLISFRFNGGNRVEAPIADASPVIDSPTSFIAKWTEVKDATSYSLELSDITPNRTETLANEDFATNEKFLIDKNGAAIDKDSSIDIGEKLDEYFNSTGWTGSKLYVSPSQLKMGSSKAAGILQSPLYDAPAGGRISVTVGVRQYGNDNGVLVVSVVDAAGTELGKENVVPEGKIREVTFENINEKFYLRIATSTKRAYLTYLSVAIGSASTQVISGITTTSYHVEGITQGHTYAYRVKAFSASGESEWSNRVEVTLNGSNGIDCINGEDTAGKTIYNLAGQRVSQIGRGIYIINGKKVIGQ